MQVKFIIELHKFFIWSNKNYNYLRPKVVTFIDPQRLQVNKKYQTL